MAYARLAGYVWRVSDLHSFSCPWFRSLVFSSLTLTLTLTLRPGRRLSSGDKADEADEADHSGHVMSHAQHEPTPPKPGGNMFNACAIDASLACLLSLSSIKSNYADDVGRGPGRRLVSAPVRHHHDYFSRRQVEQSSILNQSLSEMALH